jgi:hypothetical protein
MPSPGLQSRSGLGPRSKPSTGNRVPSHIMETVRRLGLRLDRGLPLEVLTGGIVAPSESIGPRSLGAEQFNVRKRPFTSSAPPSLASGEAPSSGSPAAGPTRTAAPLKCASSRELYEAEIGAIQIAYPGTRIWQGEQGLWLLTTSSVACGLNWAATFLTAVSWSEAAVKAWGFWMDTPVQVRWIGPRHTNFPDGSVCAFDPADGTWVFGAPLVTLLDLYSVWALRHLHLDLFQHWPGLQSVLHPYERQLEFNPTESCGCGSGRSYESCCARPDRTRSVLPDAVSFAMQFRGGSREPPRDIAQAVLHAIEPPSISALNWR